MKMIIDAPSAERLAALEEGCSVTAGSLDPATFTRKVDEVRSREPERELYLGVFSKLISMKRRDAGLTIEQLSAKADVDAFEILDIEESLRVAPEPRVVSKIARALGLPAGKLMQLVGHLTVVDTSVPCAALKFAAGSGSVQKLSREEKAALNDFVKALSQD
jgi:transcriptional regulator with XRE-family HTH domain